MAHPTQDTGPRLPATDPPPAGAGMELLLACTRPDGGDAEIEALLVPDIDWEGLVRAALLHGISPLLAQRLLLLRSPRLPAEIHAALEAHLEDVRERNRLLAGALIELLDGLGAAGVRALPFKGATLSAAAFGDFTLRRANDVDILLRRRDVKTATAVLTRLGYEELVERQYGQRVTPRVHAECLRYQCAYSFVRPRDNVVVQPHWAIVPRALAVDFDYEGIWDRASCVSLNGRETPTLAPPDLLHVLCVHACKHEWARLQWTCDVAAVLATHARLDLVTVLAAARSRGFERMLLVGLGLAQRLYAAVVPAAVADRLGEDARARGLIDRFAGILRGGPLPGPSAPSSRVPSRLRWALRERRIDRVRYLVRTLLSPTATQLRVAPLPPALRVLYAPMRLAYSVARWAWRQLRAASHRPGAAGRG